MFHQSEASIPRSLFNTFAADDTDLCHGFSGFLGENLFFRLQKVGPMGRTYPDQARPSPVPVPGPTRNGGRRAPFRVGLGPAPGSIGPGPGKLDPSNPILVATIGV